jgi:hypothetical protein
LIEETKVRLTEKIDNMKNMLQIGANAFTFNKVSGELIWQVFFSYFIWMKEREHWDKTKRTKERKSRK